MREASRFDFFQVADEHKCMQKSTGRCGVSPLEGVAENALQLRRGEGVPRLNFENKKCFLVLDFFCVDLCVSVEKDISDVKKRIRHKERKNVSNKSNLQTRRCRSHP